MAKARKAKRRAPRRRTTKAKPRRRRTSSKLKLNMAGIKKAVDVKDVVMVALGALAARAGYGVLSQELGDQPQELRMAAAAILPAVAALAISGKKKTVIPVAMGAAGSVLIDYLAPMIADSLNQYPQVAAAIAQGTGQDVAMVAPPAEMLPAEMLPAVMGEYNYGMLGAPDAYGLGAPDAYGLGLGDIDLLYGP